MQVKMAAEIGQDLNDKNEELTHELQESRSSSRRCALPHLLFQAAGGAGCSRLGALSSGQPAVGVQATMLKNCGFEMNWRVSGNEIVQQKYSPASSSWFCRTVLAMQSRARLAKEIGQRALIRSNWAAEGHKRSRAWRWRRTGRPTPPAVAKRPCLSRFLALSTAPLHFPLCATAWSRPPRGQAPRTWH